MSMIQSNIIQRNIHDHNKNETVAFYYKDLDGFFFHFINPSFIIYQNDKISTGR